MLLGCVGKTLPLPCPLRKLRLFGEYSQKMWYLIKILHSPMVASFTAILAPFRYFTGWQDLTVGKPRAAHTDVLGLIPRNLW